MTQILLVGSDEPLLEGLAQSFAALGHPTRVARSVAEGREMAAATPPLVAIMERGLLAENGGDALGINLAAGGALVLYHTVGTSAQPLPHRLQRQVLAELLALPLERHRLVSLVQHVGERATVTGRGRTEDPGERAPL